MPMNPRTMRPTAATRRLWVASSYANLARLTGFIFISEDGQTFTAIGPDEGSFVPETGLNDPTIMSWRGEFFIVYGDGPPGWTGVGPRLHIARSRDLLNWEPVVTLVSGPVAPSPGADIPNWVIDDQGPALLWCGWDNESDASHCVNCIRPLSQDPATWGSQSNWSAITQLTDANNDRLIQGNTYIVYKNGTYYMAFNDVGWSGYKTRTSSSLTSGWSASASISLGSGEANGGDTQPLILKEDGTFRLYTTNGNSHSYELWYNESSDFVNWGPSVPLSFIGMGEGYGINWTHVSRVTIPVSLASRLFAEFTPPPPPPPPPPTPPSPADSQLLLHFDTDLSDASENDLTATAYGDAAVDGTLSKWGAGSLLLDGDGDYVEVESSSAFAFSTFTVEAWIYVISWPQYCWLVDFRDGGAFTLGFGSGKFYPYVGNVDSAQTSGTAIPTGEWVHVAFVYDGTSVKCYKNGVLSYTLNDADASQSANGPKIGSNSSGGGEFFHGRIDDLRISSNVVYSGNFTPPTEPFPSYAPPPPSVSLLLNFDGDFTDSSPNGLTVTANGDATISTATKKYGSGALYLDGDGDSLTVPHSSGFDFGTGDFTVELWAWFNDASSYRAFVQLQDVWVFYFYADDSAIYWGVPLVSNDVQGAFTPTTNTWHHIAASRSGDTLRIFVDGAEVASGTAAGSYSSGSSGDLSVGTYVGEYFDGYIDDLRIVKGLAVYTSNFTPPAGPLSATL